MILDKSRVRNFTCLELCGKLWLEKNSKIFSLKRKIGEGNWAKGKEKVGERDYDVSRFFKYRCTRMV